MDKLRIVLTADPEIAVPPRLYGGIERIVAALADELAARGHEVTLVASPQSTAAGTLRPWPAPTSTRKGDLLRNAVFFAGLMRELGRRRGPKPVVHSFARLAYLAAPLLRGTLALQSYQRLVTPRSARLGAAMGARTILFTACSKDTIGAAKAHGDWRVVYNCADFARITPALAVPADAPLAFLGRVERIKGVHTAIAVARKTGRKLVIAGNIPAEHQGYADAEVLAYCDGQQISYIGPVDDKQKAALLKSAACLLFPIEWDEPFGIVMAEAMACGTPVLAIRRGSTPEVVDEGVTGMLATDADDMAAKVDAVTRLSRATCYAAARARFGAGVITDAYELLYRELLARGPAS